MKHVALVAVLVGCGAQVFYTGSDRWWQESKFAKQSLEQRASFDLSCPGASLQYQQLGTTWKTVGVAGCERRSTYVYDDYHQLWIMNTDEKAASK